MWIYYLKPLAIKLVLVRNKKGYILSFGLVKSKRGTHLVLAIGYGLKKLQTCQISWTS